MSLLHLSKTFNKMEFSRESVVIHIHFLYAFSRYITYYIYIYISSELAYLHIRIINAM